MSLITNKRREYGQFWVGVTEGATTLSLSDQLPLI